jgi:hypothetical protein
MNTTYVTALYEINTADARSHSSPEKRIALLKQLLQVQAPFVVFLDPVYRDLVDPQEFPHAVFRYDPLQSFATHTLLMTAPLHLPGHRNQSKDTQEFLTLMNMKAEFVVRAGQHQPTEYVAWIDASIFHVVRDVEKVVAHLSAGVQRPLTTPLLLPGCRRPTGGVSSATLAQQIQWTFCGGLFVATPDGARLFHEACRSILKRWVAAGKITWEVNIWIEFAHENPTAYEWTYADHNDSLCMCI